MIDVASSHSNATIQFRNQWAGLGKEERDHMTTVTSGRQRQNLGRVKTQYQLLIQSFLILEPFQTYNHMPVVLSVT